MIQTGLESYGRRDIEAADAEILALALEAAEAAGAGPLKVRIGDARVFDGVLGALGLPEVWLRRVRRGLAQGRPLEAILNGGGRARMSQSGVLAALERADHAGAKALVEDLLADRRHRQRSAGASVGEIADRFLEQAVGARRRGRQRRAAGDASPLPRDFRRSRRGARPSCARSPSDAKLDIAAALDSFDERVGFLAARGLDDRRFRLLRRLRARPRLLHRLRVRGGRRRRAGGAPGDRRRPL